MLNSCKLDLAKRLKAEALNKFGNSKVELETLIREVVDSLGLNDPSEQQSLFNEILSWVTEDIHAIPKTTKENIIRFFEDKEGNINKRLYINTKRLVRSKIIDAIFNSDLSLDDSSISNMLKWYSEDLYDLQYEGNIGSSIQHYLDIQNDINNANADDIANYLIANHLPTVISVWFDDVISYDLDTNTYEFLQSHDISRDWTQEKMPELNNILKLMLEATPLIDRNFNEINVRLKQKDFIDSAIKIIQSMNHEDYQKFVKDPYYIIEYLTELFGPNMLPSTVDNFSTNMMRSFVHQWIKNLSNNEDHPLYTKSFDNTGFSHNPIDIFVRAFSKYNSKEYIDFYLEHENTRFSNEVGINSTEYGRFCDFVESIEHLLYPEIFDEKWDIKPNADFSKLSKDVFGNYYDPKTRTKFKDLVKLISAFKKKGADDFAEYIKSIEGASSLLIGEINIANRFNPYAISGSVTNAADKSLPVTGLNSVANNIEEESMRAQMRVEEEQQIYINHGMVAPETPIKHTFFATHRKSSKENIFIKTIFRSSIAADVSGEKIIKDVGDMSIPESFMLSFIEDFYKEWFENGQTIRIQAITPSDKALIPFFEFSIENIKKRYGKTNTEIETKVLKEYENMYGQMLLNTVLDFAQVLSEANDFTQQEAAKKLLESITSTNYTNIGIDKLKQLVTDLNTILKASNLSPDTINLYTARFNTKYKTNKIIANIHDYQYNREVMQISPYLLGAMEMFTSPNGLDNLYARFLVEVNQEIGDFIVGSETISAKSLLNDNGSLKSNAKKSPLFTYFILKNILSENILMNTVGTPASHKHSGDFNKMDSSAHLTMVKRMVALTATMHAGMENVLSGLPKNIKTMTIANDILEMFTYSGNSTSGNSFLADLECWDGAMFSTGVTSMLIKQSITDVKPSGMDQKLLCHSFDPFKGAAVLLKMANYTIDNAFLRSFYFPGFSETQRNNPMLFMQTSFDQARINPKISINEDGHLIDYDGSEIYIMNYFLRDGEIIEIEDFVYNANTGKFNIIYKTADGKIESNELENNLFAIWQAFGGQFSCDKDGNYNEDSQRFLFTLINQLGEKKTKGNVRTQNDVDQYLKQQIIYYFPTSSASKSLKTPTTELYEAANDVEKRYTYDVDINHFGFQLDPDHEAEDGTVREISQLMSFIAEKMYVPEHTKRIYQNLKRLLDLLNAHTFINVNAISDYQLREQYRRKVNDVFEQKLIRIFSDPNTDAMGLVNQIAKELLKIQTDLHIPYSDGQMIGKMHTSVGVEFNKYIARQWSGRADVIVPSHNLAMIYEDEEGNTYMANDKKYLPDGETISIGQYLHDLVWVEDGVMDQAYYEANVIDAYEVMPTDVYYHYVPNIDLTIRGTWEAVTIEGWNQLNAVRDDILNGGIYVKAIDRPRNLRSKQVYIDITTSNGNSRRIGMYHFATMQKIANLGIALDDKTLTKEQKDVILKEKKELQHYFENIVLPAIAENNINILQEELVNILDSTNIESPEILTSFEYVVREEERLTTNNYSRVFGIKNMNFSEISQKKEMYFYEHLKKRYSELDVKDLDLTKASTILFSSDGTPTIITDIETIKNSQYYVEAHPIIDEDGYRVDNHGEQMYKWSENVRLYKYKFGSLEVEAIVLPELTNGVNPLLEEILDTGNFIFYKGNPINGKNLYDLNSSNIDDIFMRIARKQYKSWLKSNESIIARIPSQSLTFAMSIKTVGYLPYGNNLTMVSSTRNYLSGEDFDIDKIYAIMASLNRNGIYDEYENGNLNIVNFNNSPVVDISTISDIELELYENLLELVNYVDDKNYNSILLSFTDKVKSLLIENDITLDKNILYSLLLSKSFITNKSIIDKIFKDIHFELLAKTGLEQSRKNKSSGLQNYILESIISLYRDPRTLVAANNPTTMNPIHEAVDSVGAGKELRSHWDAFTDIYVNQTTAVGKKDIGISAVAQKAFYALTFYDEVRKSQGRSVFNPLMIEVPNSWGGNIYSYGFPDTKIDENSINVLLSEMFNNPLDWTEYNTYTDTIPNVRHFVHKSGVNVFVKTEQYDDYTKYLLYVGEDWESAKQIKPGDYFGEFSVTTLNSAIISSSTDNAKEMMMDLLNATPEILPAYEYLLSIGCDIRQAAKILTDPIIKAIITVTRGNLFLGDKGFSKSSKVFSKKGKERVQEIMQRRSDYDNDTFEAKWKCLNKIFDGAAELTMLGQALGINQGVKVEFGEPLLYQLQFERRLRDKKIFLNLEMFLADYKPNEEIVLIPGSYAERKIAEYEKVKERINLLDLIYSVPHFHSMFTIPIQFRNTVQLLSKDIDNVYSIAYKQGISTYWDQSSLRQLLKAVNDRKIADFFIKYPFVYQAETKLIWHNNRIEERPMEDEPWKLSTATSEGLLTLKEYIETNVIPWIRKMYPTNEFVTNLIPSSRFNDLFGIRTLFYGSRINLSDPQYEDQMFIIKTAFDKISKEEFNGHTISEWMFVYDLLVNKHAIGKNSITMLFENDVDLSSNNIISQWESFITEYDQSYGKYPTNSKPFNNLPIHKSDNEDEYGDAMWANIPLSNIPSWAPDPDYLPLYVEGNKITTDILVDRSTLYEAFRRGFLRANKC